MDDPQLSGPTLSACLRQLHLINLCLGGYAVSRKGLQQLLQTASLSPSTPLQIADLGCGGGESLIAMARWLQTHDIPAQLTGIDMNGHIVAYARENTRHFPNISIVQANLYDPEFQQQVFDILTCNLLLHHFSHAQLHQLLPQLVRQARIGIVVNDLQRHWLPFCLFSLLTWVAGAARIIRHDGRVSIRRSFTYRELVQLLQAYSPHSPSVQWKWAFRYLGIIPTQHANIS